MRRQFSKKHPEDLQKESTWEGGQPVWKKFFPGITNDMCVLLPCGWSAHPGNATQHNKAKPIHNNTSGVAIAELSQDMGHCVISGGGEALGQHRLELLHHHVVFPCGGWQSSGQGSAALQRLSGEGWWKARQAPRQGERCCTRSAVAGLEPVQLCRNSVHRCHGVQTRAVGGCESGRSGGWTRHPCRSVAQRAAPQRKDPFHSKTGTPANSVPGTPRARERPPGRTPRTTARQGETTSSPRWALHRKLNSSSAASRTSSRTLATATVCGGAQEGAGEEE